MNQWGLALAAGVVIITAVQLLAYYYFMRGRRDRSAWASSTGEGAGNHSGRAGGPDPGGERGDAADRENVTQCSRCGALNRTDQMFTYCRNCAQQLT